MYDSRRRIGRFAQMIRTRTDMHTKLVVLDAYIGLVLGLVLGLVPLTKRLEQPEQFLVTPSFMHIVAEMNILSHDLLTLL